MDNKKERIYWIDNMRALLIFLVVLGHMLEIINFPMKKLIYMFIYSFHMPAFVFLSGICYKPGKPGEYKVSRNILYSYVIFQIVWFIFDRYVMKSQVQLQFTKPTWIQWYLLSLGTWYIIADRFIITKKSSIWLLLLSTVASILVGNNSSFGYFLSLSRTISFFPYFILGMIVKANMQGFNELRTKSTVRVISVGYLILGIWGIIREKDLAESKWLYNSASYKLSGSNLWYRFYFMIIALMVISFLVCFAPNKKLGLLTRVGVNSFNIYVLHGFIIKLLKMMNYGKNLSYPFVETFVLSLFVVFVLSSDILSTVLKPVMRFPSISHKK